MKTLMDMTPEERIALVRKLEEEGKTLSMRKQALGEPCPKCGNQTLERKYNFLSGLFGGFVSCLTDGCDHRESSYSFFGRTRVQGQPLPDGAEPIYTLPAIPLQVSHIVFQEDGTAKVEREEEEEP
jgi:hypothetical protein